MRPIRRQPLPGRQPGRYVTQPSDDARNAAAAEEKKRLRPLCLARRDGLSPGERAAANEALCQTLFASEPWQTANLICLYVPMRGEPDVLPVWRRAIGLGKRVALPVCGSGQRLSFRAVPGSTAYLQAGPYGTREPTKNCPDVPEDQLTDALMLVPGLSFDPSGYRLGYGGGYYDTLLCGLFMRGIHPVTIGIVYDCCLAPSLPRQTHDIPVHYILSEGRLTPTHA